LFDKQSEKGRKEDKKNDARVLIPSHVFLITLINNNQPSIVVIYPNCKNPIKPHTKSVMTGENPYATFNIF